jgi:superfamily II DNA or RNA helicase
MRDAVARGRRVLFLAHRVELVSQCEKKLVEMGVSGVTVSTAQSLASPGAVLPHADVVIVDECHTQHANSVLDAYDKDIIVIGLTATPLRGTGRPIGSEYEEMVLAAAYSELVAEGAILAPIAWAPNTPELGKTKDDFTQNEMLEEMSKPAIVGNVVETWKEHGHGEPTICFAVNRRHAEILLTEFRGAGIDADVVVATTPWDERSWSIERFRAGKLPVIISVGVLTEGFDAPECRNIILARPTQSLALYLQMCGRACRPLPGKTSYRIFDHASNILTHGFPHIDREWALAKKPKPPEQIKVGLRVCANFHVYESGPVCPVCGSVAQSDERPIRMLDGKLVQVHNVVVQHCEATTLMAKAVDLRKRKQHLFIKGRAVGMLGAELSAWVERKLGELR